MNDGKKPPFSGPPEDNVPVGELTEQAIHTVDYIRKMCRDLKRMAESERLPMLRYLLEMAEYDARQTLKSTTKKSK